METRDIEAMATRIRVARKAIGMSKRKFCAVYGMTFTSLRGYELGISRPGKDLIAAFSRAGISINWLLVGLGSMRKIDTGHETGTQRCACWNCAQCARGDLT